MKSKQVWLFAVVAVLAVATLPVAAEQETQPRGKYAELGEASCLNSTLGFNADLTTVAGSGVYSESFSWHGIVHFGSDGTATGQNTTITIVVPPHPANASSEEFSSSSSYSVAHDGTLTVDATELVGTFLTGADAGLGYSLTVDRPSLTGRIGRNGTVLLSSAAPTVETVTFLNSSGGIVYSSPRICHRRVVLVPVDKD